MSNYGPIIMIYGFVILSYLSRLKKTQKFLKSLNTSYVNALYHKCVTIGNCINYP